MDISKLFPVVKATLVRSVAALHLAVMPRCSGRYQFVRYLFNCQSRNHMYLVAETTLCILTLSFTLSSVS